MQLATMQGRLDNDGSDDDDESLASGFIWKTVISKGSVSKCHRRDIFTSSLVCERVRAA